MSLCLCGCGRKTWVPKTNNAARGWVAGQPVRYLRGHDRPNSGRSIDKRGYVLFRAPGHPKATKRGQYVREHILVAERAIGRHLPDSAVVHHVNGDRGDNRPRNLVICEDQGHHLLLHLRAEARNETGDPEQRRCHLCGEFDRPENLYIGSGPRNRTVRHRACHAAHEARRRIQA